MKGLKEFIEDLAKDNNLREKFKDITDPEEVVKMAKKEGYEFTEDEYMDKQLENVSGGGMTQVGCFPIRTIVNKNSNVCKFLLPNIGGELTLVTVTFGKDGSERTECRPATEEDIKSL